MLSALGADFLSMLGDGALSVWKNPAGGGSAGSRSELGHPMGALRRVHDPWVYRVLAETRRPWWFKRAYSPLTIDGSVL